MSKSSSCSTGLELCETTPLDFPKDKKNALLDLLCSRVGKTSRKAARAVRNFVTCSSALANGFMEADATTTTTSTQKSPSGIDFLEEETTQSPSTTEVQSKPPVRDVWSVRNGIDISPPRRRVRDRRDAKGKAGHPGHCHWRNTHGQPGAADVACNRRASRAEATSTSTCGPQLPTNFFELPTKQCLRAAKQYLASFVCKPNSETSLQANKQRPLCRLMARARMIVYKPEPIKSVEAVFLALYLTARLLSVERTPLCFKTQFADEVSQHIVIVVQHNGKYGAFGISPNPNLMTKDFQFDSMSSIVENYLNAYKAIAHIVLKIRIGLPVEHDIISTHFICWRHLCLSPDAKSWAECVVEIENHVLRMRHLWDLWVLTGKGDDPHKARISRGPLYTTCTPKPEKPTEKQQQSKANSMEESSISNDSKPMKKSTQLAQQCKRWDVESTGSNVEDDCSHCSHCQQLKREAPLSCTKHTRCVTTVNKRIKTSSSGYKSRYKSSHRNNNYTHSSSATTELENNSTGALLALAADKLGSVKHSGMHFQSHSPRSLNHVSLATTKQILKNFVHNSVLSTPPRRFAQQSGYGHGERDDSSCKVTCRHLGNWERGRSDVRRKTNGRGGPLHNLLGLMEAKSKAG